MASAKHSHSKTPTKDADGHLTAVDWIETWQFFNSFKTEFMTLANLSVRNIEGIKIQLNVLNETMINFEAKFLHLSDLYFETKGKLSAAVQSQNAQNLSAQEFDKMLTDIMSDAEASDNNTKNNKENKQNKNKNQNKNNKNKNKDNKNNSNESKNNSDSSSGSENDSESSETEYEDSDDDEDIDIEPHVSHPFFGTRYERKKRVQLEIWNDFCDNNDISSAIRKNVKLTAIWRDHVAIRCNLFESELKPILSNVLYDKFSFNMIQAGHCNASHFRHLKDTLYTLYATTNENSNYAKNKEKNILDAAVMKTGTTKS